jgi:hypothetical protein
MATLTLDAAAHSFGLGALLRRATDVRHPALPAEQVLVAKLLAAAWIATGHVAQPRSTSLACLGLLAAFGVLFSPWTRSFCVALAGTILLGLISSRASFSYNRLYCAALFGMISLSGPGPRWQAAVVYLGAGADKLFSSGWRTGSVLDAFIRDLADFGRLWSPGGHVGEPNFVARLLAHGIDLFPALPFVLSWTVIACELALAVAFLRKSRVAIGLSIAFHGAVYIVTGGTLGMFFHAGLISALLVGIPSGRIGTPAGLLCLCLWTCGPWLSPLMVAILLGAAVVLALVPRPPHGPQLDAERVQP